MEKVSYALEHIRQAIELLNNLEICGIRNAQRVSAICAILDNPVAEDVNNGKDNKDECSEEER